MKAVVAVFLILILAIVLVGCEAHTHYIGKGAQSNVKNQERQWYILFGLVPLNKIDTRDMAGQAADYTIKTQQSFLDIVLNIFTSSVTVYSRTVTVTK
jgi:hypothetical protein